MTEQVADEGWGINPVQAGAALVVLLFSVVLIFAMNDDVPTRDDMRANGAPLVFEAYQEGVRLRPRTVIPAGTEVGFRIQVRDGGHLLVYRTDGKGENIGVHPGGYDSVEVPAGEELRVSDAFAGVPAGTWFFTAVLCDDAFELDPKKPKASWSCELRDLEYKVD